MKDSNQLIIKIKDKLETLNKLEAEIDSLLIEYYEGIHPKHLFFSRHEFIIEHLEPTDVVVDLGYGNGIIPYEVSKHCKKVIGIDLSPPPDRFRRPNLVFLQGDILDMIDKIEENYSLCIASHILEHLDDPVSLLKRLRCNKVIVIVPRSEQWLVQVKREFGVSWIMDDTHRRLYTRELLRNHLLAGGFGDIKLLEFDGDNGIRAVALRGDR